MPIVTVEIPLSREQMERNKEVNELEAKAAAARAEFDKDVLNSPILASVQHLIGRSSYDRGKARVSAVYHATAHVSVTYAEYKDEDGELYPVAVKAAEKEREETRRALLGLHPTTLNQIINAATKEEKRRIFEILAPGALSPLPAEAELAPPKSADFDNPPPLPGTDK